MSNNKKIALGGVLSHVSILDMDTRGLAKFLKQSDFKNAKKYLLDRAHIWTVCCIVVSNSKERGEYFNATEFEFDQILRRKDITEFLNVEHKKLVLETELNDFCTVAWIAYNKPYVFDEHEIKDILNNLKAWDYLPNWSTETN